MALTKEAKDSCAACGGKCCKRTPGICWPHDIRPLDAPTIMAMLDTGDYAIDWWEGDPDIYWVRPTTKGCRKKLDPAWARDECSFLETAGCRLPFADRPAQCRMLIPRSSPGKGDCVCPPPYDGKEGARDAWLPHQELMVAIVHTLRMESAES